MNEPIPLRARMSVQDYDFQRAQLRELHGDHSPESVASRDQGMALLFCRTNWGQVELAEKEGKSQPWVNYRLRFGRFLSFITTVIKPDLLPRDLSEWRFRSYWERTDKLETNERIRFTAIHRLMQEGAVTAPRRPLLGEPIKKHFADGKWHRLETIASKLGTEVEHAQATLKSMEWHKTYGCKAETKRVGTRTEWRIFKLDKTVGSVELAEKLAPIIEGLKAEGKKNMATMCPPAVASLAVQLERLLAEWSE